MFLDQLQFFNSRGKEHIVYRPMEEELYLKEIQCFSLLLLLDFEACTITFGGRTKSVCTLLSN